VVIVFGYCEQAFPRDVAAAEDVFEERNHVVMFFGAAEAEDQKGVVHDLKVAQRRGQTGQSPFLCGIF